MSTTVHETKTVTLMDGTEIQVRPLKISLLRKFMKKFEGLEKAANNNDKSMDILMECVQIAMEQYAPSLDMAKLEDLMDLPTVYKIVEEASGIQMADLAAMNSMAFEE